MTVFVSNAVTAYMAFTIVYTISRGKMMPRSQFWPFLCISVAVAVFFSVYELILHLDAYKAYDNDDRLYQWAHDERKRLFVSWSFFRALFTLFDVTCLAIGYALFRQVAAGLSLLSHSSERHPRMVFYPIVQIISKFAVTWVALRPGSWNTGASTGHDDDSNAPYYVTLDVLYECITPITGMGYSLIYLYFTPGIWQMLFGGTGSSYFCKRGMPATNKTRGNRVANGLPSNNTNTNTNTNTSSSSKEEPPSMHRPAPMLSRKALSRMEEHELLACLSKTIVPKTASAAGASSAKYAEANADADAEVGNNAASTPTPTPTPTPTQTPHQEKEQVKPGPRASMRESLRLTLTSNILKISSALEVGYELSAFEEGDGEDGEEEEDGGAGEWAGEEGEARG